MNKAELSDDLTKAELEAAIESVAGEGTVDEQEDADIVDAAELSFAKNSKIRGAYYFAGNAVPEAIVADDELVGELHDAGIIE